MAYIRSVICQESAWFPRSPKLVTRAALETGGAMIKFLAQLFRGFHYILGISAPPPSTGDRTHVLHTVTLRSRIEVTGHFASGA